MTTHRASNMAENTKTIISRTNSNPKFEPRKKNIRKNHWILNEIQIAKYLRIFEQTGATHSQSKNYHSFRSLSQQTKWQTNVRTDGWLTDWRSNRPPINDSEWVCVVFTISWIGLELSVSLCVWILWFYGHVNMMPPQYDQQRLRYDDDDDTYDRVRITIPTGATNSFIHP